jgi:glucan phosphoethanolaminetransferase (alkaline phosphatase superfamily)
LNRAGVEVLWRDNNSSSKGVANRVTYQDFKTSGNNPICDVVFDFSSTMQSLEIKNNRYKQWYCRRHY